MARNIKLRELGQAVVCAHQLFWQFGFRDIERRQVYP
jgi:hypothetical protein